MEVLHGFYISLVLVKVVNVTTVGSHSAVVENEMVGRLSRRTKGVDGRISNKSCIFGLKRKISYSVSYGEKTSFGRYRGFK